MNNISSNINEYNYVAILEAILFAFAKPIDIKDLSLAINLTEIETLNYLGVLQNQLLNDDRGIQLNKLGNNFSLSTKLCYETFIKTALNQDKKTPISKSAMEVLSIIAYNAPCSRGYVDKIRGVDSSYLVKNLLEKGLIEEAGRLNILGKPMSYKTTDLFLLSFSLSSLDELTPLPEELIINNSDSEKPKDTVDTLTL